MKNNLKFKFWYPYILLEHSHVESRVALRLNKSVSPVNRRSIRQKISWEEICFSCLFRGEKMVNNYIIKPSSSSILPMELNIEKIS